MKMNIIKRYGWRRKNGEITRKRRQKKSLCARTHIIHWQHKFSVEKEGKIVWYRRHLVML